MKLATLCYVQHAGKTLMIHRNRREGDIHLGKWNGLGGKFERGESPEECAVREIEEESGLLVTNPALRGFLTFPLFAKGEDWYVFVFTASEFTGELRDCAEGHLEWIDSDRLLELNLWPGDQFFIPLLDQDRLFSGKFCYVDGELVSYEICLH